MSSTSSNTSGGSVERSELPTSSGHKPGVNVGNDAIPEFTAQAIPAGLAPKESTFLPNSSEAVSEGQGEGAGGEGAKAMEGITGATSGDVHKSVGGK
ncbi:hypothetical protein LTR91_017834 [Friedmanniomyces endolithicus]|uniref:Uncharacterized protein n=1 Tax=Friedmanniomyces endolithicus TaxID=329885 RepID=A0AAN6HDP1_9PEZI|nr:hypothetical protein LTR94_012638 [Friedmanniomyces endolithicus]KAK0795094.1 hypothetical protein LTR38_009017 [Friedmanniomyces endolithicus]KAK0798595.1 hypothetical protein LTR59_006368 [Friedmanniomyces endolithicus]KAK0798854.1 hypothetical protein LTR75_009403 [Friedmanniomyces endolithicus]KAK0841036.1 hypothetical protein LTR03_010178 [Friedmanniomyces endolithicus]